MPGIPELKKEKISSQEKLPAIFRNPDGTLIFNSAIPPELDVPDYLWPTNPDGPSKKQLPSGGDVALSKSQSMQEGGATKPLPQRAIDGAAEKEDIDPTQTKSGKASSITGEGGGLAVPKTEASKSSWEIDESENSRRPVVQRNWQTTRPEQTRKTTIPVMERRGTNVSALNEAIWNHPNYNDHGSSSDSSTSSSSDSDSGGEKKPRSRWKRGGENKADDAASQRKQTRRGYRKFNVGNDDYKTKGKVDKQDGRLNISVKDTNNSGYLAKALGASFMKRIGHGADPSGDDEYRQRLRHQEKAGYLKRADTGERINTKESPIILNVVIMVIGSRGDIQPFLKLGKVLKEDYGHRVRIATHPAFRDFVENDSGLEFFSVGGDPAELMAFMVKNPGMIPSIETLKTGEVGKRRAAMAQMFEGFWRACINVTDDEHDVHNLKMMGDRHPFVADAIIANPPSFAHVHCAERLGIPLHLMFTFPYTPTTAFPHPLANIKKTNMDPGYTNFISYPLVEMMTWQGLGDLVNDFRVNTLGLEPVSTLWAPGQLYRLRVPYTYLWSPGLVPKPTDWGGEIDIAGFVFLDLASNFKPPDELVKFLKDGEPPIYIGFGSIVVDDPDKFTKMIYEAVEKAGVRALVSKGWGGFGGDDSSPNVHMLENTPHDWLFPKVKAVVHHGGAGTTAIGLKCGKPTLVVPFFGDQFFWGNMIGRAGAGAMPIPYKELTADKLREAIQFLLEDETQKQADVFAKKIEEEGDGAQNAVKSFHRCLTLRGEQSMTCSILDDRLAVWMVKKTNLRLSALAADILRNQRKVRWDDLRLIRHVEWNDFEGPGEPLSGGATALTGNLASAAAGVAGIPFRLARSAKKRRTDEEKKAHRQAKAEARAKHRARRREVHGHGVHGTHHSQRDASADANLTKGIAKRDMLPQNDVPNNIATKDSVDAGNAIFGGPSATSTGAAANQNHELLNQHVSNGSVDPEDVGSDAEDTDGTSVATASTAESHDAAEEVAHDIGGGFKKTGKALVRAPMDLSTAVAQGFHNAPRLYGDTTVRRPVRITGFHSGLKAAGQEFGYGVYDGFTGIVTQPYNGAKHGGLLGFVKGTAMGLTGFVLKDLAAIIGPMAYTLKGVQKELGKGKQPTHFIRRARIIQGQRDFNELSKEDRVACTKHVLHGCNVMQEFWKVIDNERENKGIRGRFRRVRERKTWRVDVKFDNVEMAEKALKAIKCGDGQTLEQVYDLQKAKLEGDGRGKMMGHRALDDKIKERDEAQKEGKIGREDDGAVRKKGFLNETEDPKLNGEGESLGLSEIRTRETVNGAEERAEVTRLPTTRESAEEPPFGAKAEHDGRANGSALST